MTNLAWIALAVAGGFAVLNWLAVGFRYKPLEYLAKPATLALLIAVAFLLDPQIDGRRWAFVVALAFSLAGDVFLMLPRDRFLFGLGSFFLAHVAYIVGLRIGMTQILPLVVATAAVLVLVLLIGRPILQAVRRDHPSMSSPVSAYMALIAVMVAAALASGNPFAATGAVIFMASDTLIAWNRFVRPLGWAPVTIMVTYHLGQAGLVLSLVTL
jgi:uncharacterized membrane protein YhhN